MGDGKGNKDLDYVVLRSDRRRDLRNQLLVLKVKGQGSKGVFFGYAKTIGRGGMFISSVNPQAVGEEFLVSFIPPGYGKDVKCKCKVVWRREFDATFKSEPGMGITFVDLDNDVKETIDEWVKKNETGFKKSDF